MKISFSATVSVAATGITTLITRGVPVGKTWTLLEIRLPTSVMTRAIVTMLVKSAPRLQLVPSIYDNSYLIEDELTELTDFVFTLEKFDATATVIGLTILVDER